MQVLLKEETLAQLVYYLKIDGKFVERAFRNIKHALCTTHETGHDLYERDEGEFNLIYSNQWDIPMRRTVWRTELSAHGYSCYNRKALPDELKKGTVGPDFEV